MVGKHKFEAAVKEKRIAVAVLDCTVQEESENTKKIQIQDMEKSWLNFQQKIRTYLREGVSN